MFHHKNDHFLLKLKIYNRNYLSQNILDISLFIHQYSIPFQKTLHDIFQGQGVFFQHKKRWSFFAPTWAKEWLKVGQITRLCIIRTLHYNHQIQYGYFITINIYRQICKTNKMIYFCSKMGKFTVKWLKISFSCHCVPYQCALA